MGHPLTVGGSRRQGSRGWGGAGTRMPSSFAVWPMEPAEPAEARVVLAKEVAVEQGMEGWGRGQCRPSKGRSSGVQERENQAANERFRSEP